MFYQPYVPDPEFADSKNLTTLGARGRSGSDTCGPIFEIRGQTNDLVKQGSDPMENGSTGA